MPSRKNNELPLDIYIPFVQALFRDGLTLAIGIAAQSFLALMVFFKTGELVYLVVALCILGIGALRLHSTRKVREIIAVRTREDAHQLENVYIFWGTLHASALGLFCFAGIYLAHDPFAEIAAVCVTLATATSIAGRNYGSPRMVMVLIIALTMPISLGFIMRADAYHVVLGLLSIPFFFAIRKFADNVRDVLFAALWEEKKANRLAARFDRALNTMSYGLIMLSTEGKVVVANNQVAALMQVSPERLIGRTLRGLLRRGVAGRMLSAEDARFIEAQLTRALRQGRDRKVLMRLLDGRYFEFSAREGHDELGVITFEEVTARIEAEERIRFMARYDSLTGLPNRAYFYEFVADHLSVGDQDRLVGLAVFDLDDFKGVNDTLGHRVGDGLIRAVAQRLGRIATPDIRISRFGGDEFMIFFNDAGNQEEFERQLDALFENMVGDVDVAGHALRVQASVGAVILPARDADVDAMIVKADLALYKAKEDRKNGWRLFEEVMDRAFRSRQVLMADLRLAVETRRLNVVYQPIVALDTMRIVGCETLCRWDHPELGPISPAVFIPLAEEMGIIADISTFILDTATAECTRWPAEVGVSVNLSAKDFRSADVVRKVRKALQTSGLAPSRLEVEVTETALLDDEPQTRDFIEQLKALGVRIALDDFGTGYSSLSYLRRLPLDKIKIDRSFLIDVTQNPRSLELLKGVVDLSHRLGLAVTVEGVETFEQLQVPTQEAKPDLAQGFLFGAPLSRSGIEGMLSTCLPFSAELHARPAKASDPAGI